MPLQTQRGKETLQQQITSNTTHTSGGFRVKMPSNSPVKLHPHTDHTLTYANTHAFPFPSVYHTLPLFADLSPSERERECVSHLACPHTPESSVSPNQTSSNLIRF